MRVKSLFKNTLLLGMSCLLSLLVAEAICRVFFDPIDILSPNIVRDDWLDLRIPANSGGHDALGFRNSDVPDSARIIAIGDSNTYGIAATHAESWPSQLAEQTGDTVYNMALGSYGPLQYLRLLETHALSLNPEVIVVGLYFGNDFYDAFRLANFNDKWKDYGDEISPERQPKKTLLEADDSQAGKRFAFARYWLARNSVLYRIGTTKIKPLLSGGSTQYYTPHKLTTYQPSPDATPMLFEAERWETSYKTERADLDEGLDITIQVMKEIRTYCDANNLKLVFLLIPTKERVFSDLVIASNPQVDKDRFAFIAASEDRYRDKIFATLDAENIESIDLLPLLIEGVNSRPSPIYPSYDSHPNAQGYEIIANAVAKKLEALQ